MSESDHVAVTTVMCILIITSIVGNSLVCAVIMRNGDMRIPINYLLVNLAVADTTFVMFYIPKFIPSHSFNYPKGLAGKILCALLTKGSLAWVGGYSSAFTLVAIAFERYYAVIYPHGTKRNLTNGKLKVIITCSWILSLTLATPRFHTDVHNNSCIYLMPEQVVKAASLTTLALPIISFTLMAGLYSRVVYMLWFKHNDNNGLTYHQKGVLKVQKRVTLMVVAVTVFFGISMGSDATMHILEMFGSIKLSPVAIPIARTVIMFNVAVNPFAYALINQRFREKMKRMICRRSAMVHTEREQRAQDIELANNNTQPD